jgi:hypothetical protein
MDGQPCFDDADVMGSVDVAYADSAFRRPESPDCLVAKPK